MQSGVLYNDISDHFPVFILLQIDSKITKKYEYIFKHMNTANILKNWYPDSADDTFLNILTSLINKCLPLKRSSEN